MLNVTMMLKLFFFVLKSHCIYIKTNWIQIKRITKTKIKENDKKFT